jgi:hypothetical protein
VECSEWLGQYGRSVKNALSARWRAAGNTAKHADITGKIRFIKYCFLVETPLFQGSRTRGVLEVLNFFQIGTAHNSATYAAPHVSRCVGTPTAESGKAKLIVDLPGPADASGRPYHARIRDSTTDSDSATSHQRTI